MELRFFFKYKFNYLSLSINRRVGGKWDITLFSGGNKKKKKKKWNNIEITCRGVHNNTYIPLLNTYIYIYIYICCFVYNPYKTYKEEKFQHFL